MMYAMPKETRLNLRISDEFRRDIESLAAYHGLTLSSYAHSLLVKQIRREKEATPEAFNERRQLAPVVAHIGPAEKDNIRREFQQGVERTRRGAARG
jgi:hypothetical protein